MMSEGSFFFLFHNDVSNDIDGLKNVAHSNISDIQISEQLH